MDRIGYYRGFRKVGLPAKMSWSHARIMVRWNELEEAGIVRLRMEEEREDYFSVYGKPESEKERKEILSLIDRLGCWYVFGEFKCSCCGSWNHGDGVGMIIDQDPLSPFSNIYVTDIVFETMHNLAGHESNGKEWRVF